MEDLSETTKDLLDLRKKFEFVRSDYGFILGSDLNCFNLIKSIIQNKGIYISDPIRDPFIVWFYMDLDISIENLRDLIGAGGILKNKNLLFYIDHNYWIKESQDLKNHYFDHPFIYLLIKGDSILP